MTKERFVRELMNILADDAHMTVLPGVGKVTNVFLQSVVESILPLYARGANMHITPFETLALLVLNQHCENKTTLRLAFVIEDLLGEDTDIRTVK